MVGLAASQVQLDDGLKQFIYLATKNYGKVCDAAGWCGCRGTDGLVIQVVVSLLVGSWHATVPVLRA